MQSSKLLYSRDSIFNRLSYSGLIGTYLQLLLRCRHDQSLKPCSNGLWLGKPRVARDPYLWIVVDRIRTVAPFLKHLAWQISRQHSRKRMH
ncbi:hypothetical protein AVEN_21986-1 [Araneus ventricosus]|uniref:Uncharacterized protein n=1 Tax=Araneus ventricosus TaxID=182803 RepID=A0A4Y2JBW2_ARAVE|nr:hypothetical protein AVEN_21986-1 [Araneus ventricosus]